MVWCKCLTALRDNVERWLIHENYKFDEIKTDDDNFKIIIKNGDAFGNPLEIHLWPRAYAPEPLAQSLWPRANGPEPMAQSLWPRRNLKGF